MLPEEGAIKSVFAIIFVLTLTLGILAVRPAHAACSTPPGSAGDILYNDNHHVLQYCNGTLWRAAGPVPGAGGPGCTGPIGVEADLMYNHDRRVMQYCDGQNWIAMGPVNDDVTGGLAGHWKLDDGVGSGTAADSSGNGNTGTLTNMDPATDWVTGKHTGALDFDGTDDYVDLGTGLDLINDMTVGYWIKLDMAADAKVVIANEDFNSSPWAASYLVEIDNPGVPYWRWYHHQSGGDWSSILAFSDHTIPTGTWNHYIFVRKIADKSVTLYVNGNAVQTLNWTTDNPGATTAEPAYIGSVDPGGSTRFIDGALDDVRVYNRALSADEVQKIYFATQPIALESGLVGHWKLDESGNTSTAADSSGQGSDGALTNFPADPSANWVTGKLGNALDFDGTDDYVTTPAAGLPDNQQDITITGWFYPHNVNAQNWGWIAGQSNNLDHAEVRYGLYFNASNATVYGNVGGSATLHSTTITANQWHFFALVNSADGYRMTINTTTDTAAAKPAPVSDTINWTIGKWGSQTNTFNGLLDDVRVYNRALTEGEIKKLATPPPDLEHGLIGHWTLDDGTGNTTALDSSGNGNDGSLTNMDANADWVSGRLGNALDFDGSDDYVQMGDVSALEFDASTSFTVSAWAKANNTAGIKKVVAKKQNGNSNTVGYHIQFDSSENVNFNMADGADAGTVTVTVGNTNWHHLVLVADRSTNQMRAYVDGVAATPVDISLIGSVAQSNPASFNIGNMGNLNTPMSGLIDEVRVYNRVLTDEEIRLLASPIALESGLVGHWTLDESGNVATATDSSGSGNNGTLTNFPADPSADWVTGRIGNALAFDGTDDYVLVPHDSSLESNGSITLAAWIYPKSDAAPQNILAKLDCSGGGGGGWRLRRNNDSASFEFTYRYGAGNGENITVNAANPLNGWTHITVVKDGATLRTYENGAQSDTDALASATMLSAGTRDFGIAESDPGCGATGYFNGQIDDVRVYNRALNEAEIKFLSSPCQNPGHMPGTMLYNDDHTVLQYCNGSEWIGIGK